MDGFAVRAADTVGAGPDAPITFHLIETVHSGQMPSHTVTAGGCTQIATGAPVPDGADAVVMVEETERDGETVRVHASVEPRRNIGRRGADITAGQMLLEAGDVLTPSRVGSIAALGQAEVEVYDRPRVGLLSTGDEIVEPGEPLAPGQIYDVNRFTLASVIQAHGGTATIHPVTGDSLAALGEAVERIIAAGADILIFSGGSSVGERDLTLDVMRERGEVTFHGIAVKPGKPTAFGRIGATPVFGMPGYPTSCLSNAYLLLIPFLRRVARLPAHQRLEGDRARRAPLFLAAEPASVVHGAPDRRRRGRRVQGVGRHHQHVAGGRLRRDPGWRGCRGGGHAGRRDPVLTTAGVLSGGTTGTTGRSAPGSGTSSCSRARCGGTGGRLQA